MTQQLLPHTAAAIWSGFIYQGRFGLYDTLSATFKQERSNFQRCVAKSISP